MIEFDEYKRLGEPNKKEKAENWECAIGLQQVDGLVPSEYLIAMAKSNIEGDITIADVKEGLSNYYKENPRAAADTNRKQEADIVSARIVEILGEKAFSLSPIEYINIHKRLFDGVYEFAGKIRDYNISKDEWVLDGDTVLYASAGSLKETLDYHLSTERVFKYDGLSKREIVEHIATFIANVWQVHIFGEGNTRTTAVFLIKYLRKLGFKNADNDLFAANSWYFRNALVRANYEDVTHGVTKTAEHLIKFLENLVLGGKNELLNRNLQVAKSDTVKAKSDTVKAESGTVKAENATVKEESDTVKVKSDTVKVKSDTVKAKSDTVKKEKETVVTLIKANINITAVEIAVQLGLSLTTAKRRISSLKAEGKIVRIGSDKAGIWKVQ